METRTYATTVLLEGSTIVVREFKEGRLWIDAPGWVVEALRWSEEARELSKRDPADTAGIRLRIDLVINALKCAQGDRSALGLPPPAR